MSISRRDVELLQQTGNSLTDTILAKNRQRLAEQAEQEAIRRNLADEDLRRQMQQATQTHYNAEEQHYKNMEESAAQGTAEGWFTGPGGHVAKFHGPKAAFDKILAQPGVSQVDEPAKETQKNHVTMHIGDADIVQYIPDEAVPGYMKKLQEAAAATPSTKGFHTAKDWNDIKATQLEQQAEDLKAQQATITGPEAPYLQPQIDKLNQRAKYFRDETGTTKEPTQDVTIEYSGTGPNATAKVTGSRMRIPVGANPLSLIPAKPSTNAPAARPQYAPAPAQPTPAGSASAVPAPSQRQVGQVYQTPKGPLKWTGTGWVQP